jgi:putative protease
MTKKKRKPVRKAVKKTKGKAKPKKSVAKPKKAEKPIGSVTHFYTKIKVAVIKFKAPFRAGQAVRFRGATTDFEQKLSSLQYDHKPISSVRKGQGVGAKVAKRVREGDLVFAVRK